MVAGPERPDRGAPLIPATVAPRPNPDDGRRSRLAPETPVALGLLALFFVLLVSIARWYWFMNDEIEHVHSAWYVASGRVPFRDFFEHHHSLLWYVLAPLLSLFGESSATLLWVRGLYLVQATAILLMTAALAVRATGSPAAGPLAALALVASTSFLSTAVVIRPDVPQTLCGVASSLFFLRALEEGRRRDALASGVLLGLAFVFLQKALPFVPVLAIALAVAAWRRRVRVSVLPAFVAGFAAPCLAAAVHLAAQGAWTAYVQMNWAFNALAVARFPRAALARVFLPNLAFWTLALWGLYRLARSKGAPFGLRSLGAAGALLIAVLLLARRIDDRHVFSALPFLAVVVAWHLEALFRDRRWGRTARAAVLLALTLVPLGGGLRLVSWNNAAQRARIDFVLRNTTPQDTVYDGDAQFNLFREDLHYVWFGIARPIHAIETVNLVTSGRYAGYDVCALVDQKKPRVISSYALDRRRCGLFERYDETPFSDVFLRAD